MTTVGEAIANEPRAGARWRVLSFIIEQGDVGATDDEIASGLSSKINAIQARRVELVYAGFVEAAASKRTGQGGKPATVWRVIPSERLHYAVEEVQLSHDEKVAAREQLAGLLRSTFASPADAPVELVKLAQWLRFKTTRTR